MDVLSRSRRRSNRDGAKPGSFLMSCLDQVGGDQEMAVLQEMNDLDAGHDEFVKSLAPRIDVP